MPSDQEILSPSTGREVPTVEDVARRAGVSTATVSRCLNAPDRLATKTRERVMQAIEELGYAPNFGARALAARRTNTVGAIIPTMENSIFARGLQAFQEELGRHGVTLLVASTAYRPDLEEQQIRSLTARGADGLFLIGYDRSPEIYDLLRRRGVPFLVGWAHDETMDHLAVGFDNSASMKALAERVIKMGHRSIAVISAPRATNDRARERVEGIFEAIEEHGLDSAKVRVVETPYSLEAGGSAFRSLMSGSEPPTAVLCGNDVLAVGALGVAKEMGLDVPGDVSITGFDDIELAQITTPQLTTVHVPHREMGRRAAGMLVQLIHGETVSGSICLGTDVRMRQTLGPAPSSGK